VFWKVIQFGDPTPMFLAVLVDADGRHAGRVEGALPHLRWEDAVRDGQRAGVDEWTNPYETR